MGGRPILPVLLATVLLAGASGAVAAAPAVPLDIGEGALATALVDLARQARVELVFDQRLLKGLRARPLRGRYTAEAAFARLLSGSGFGYRTTADGAFVLFALPAPQPLPTAERDDGAVSELLVVGRRTQNVGIRRTENDMQPYRVFGRRAIEGAGRDTVDEFLRARENANTQPGPLSLGGGDIRSSINLRGFGESSTLVLVDGRRMPFVPSALGELGQANINGIPPGAVERIEVLTAPAGGIYGPGAIGGVVNVVLRRDYRGADLTVSGGGSDQADAGHYRLEGRLGFTPDHGATDVMLYVAHSRTAPLATGRRNFADRAGRLLFGNDPDTYAADVRGRNGISVTSLGGELTLDPEYGGGSLGARYTFLPTGFSGTRAEAAALMAANAGRLALDLSDDFTGKRRYIATAPSATSGLLNVRRRLGQRVELFFDGFYSRERGRFEDSGGLSPFRIGASQAGNPFGQNIDLTFPVGVLHDDTEYGIDTSRWTVGTIVDLPRGWKGSADFTMARSLVRGASQQMNAGLRQAVVSGGPGPNGEPPIRPFEDWAALVAALPAYVESQPEILRLNGRFRAASLRMSGPLVTLPGGPMTVTLLGEERQDRVADSETAFFGLYVPLPSRTQRVRSGYAELRMPVGPSDAKTILMRGLELQLAARYDRSTQRGPLQALTIGTEAGERFSVGHNASTFTAGARLRPMSKLMLRGSVATGERPPTFANLQVIPSTFFVGPADPKRAGRPAGTEETLNVLMGGSPRVGSARARSFAAGVVVNPDGRSGPRVSVDYSRIVVSREAGAFPLTLDELLAREAEYPERVIRAPLSATDRAAGLTAGPVTTLDTTAINLGRSVVEAVDVQVDWLLSTDRLGDVRIYGAATWQPTFRSRLSPASATVDRTNYPDGPLEWRGNVGVEWARGPWSVDLNLQYYGSYRVGFAGQPSDTAVEYARRQGAARIPGQFYVDLGGRRRFTAPRGVAPLRTFEVRLSIQNLLDRSPPVVADSTHLGFSPYGDPRRRRGVVTLAAQF